MKTFAWFGTPLTGPELRDRLVAALGLDFEERYSDYWGGEYFKAGRSPDENFRILNNVAEDDDDIPYLDFKDYPVVLEVNMATEATLAAIEKSVEGIVLLRRKDRES
jgi:hypothetical protein